MKIEIKDILRRYSRPSLVALSALVLFAGSPEPKLNELEKLIEDGALRVASRIGPLSYYQREGEPNGLDYNLLTALAQYLGVDLDITIYEDLGTQLRSVYLEDNHVSASTLTATAARLEQYQFSDPYMEVSAVLVQHSSRKFIDDISEIMEADYSLAAISDSSHAEILAELQKDRPDLTWKEYTGVIMFELMEQVQTQQLDYAVVDSSIYEMERSMFPRVEVAVDLSEPLPVGLVFPLQEDRSLINATNEFIAWYNDSGQLDQLTDAYLGNQDRMDVAGALLFKDRLENRLPEYEPLFREVAESHDYDWLLLAAQAYQESHWDAYATSPTGVRGLMMLTLPTAKQLGVEDRLDPEQSLKGGIEYFLSLHKRIPERIPEPDRTKFALASYNVGYGHLEDARILTERGGYNPDSWEDVAKFLPLLRQKKYYSTLKHGYARGNEPVSYVNNIYRFKSILDWYTWQQELLSEEKIAVTLPTEIESLEPIDQDDETNDSEPSAEEGLIEGEEAESEAQKNDVVEEQNSTNSKLAEERTTLAGATR